MSRAEPEKVGEEAREQRRECREREAASRATIHHNYEFEPSKDSSANEARNCMEEHLSAGCCCATADDITRGDGCDGSGRAVAVKAALARAALGRRWKLRALQRRG